MAARLLGNIETYNRPQKKLLSGDTEQRRDGHERLETSWERLS